jgi:GTP-dependent phosphoenolpyruvate carboxykinase
MWFRAYLAHGTNIQIRCPKCNMFYLIGKGDDGIFLKEELPEAVSVLTYFIIYASI